jgi:hypothetical protein
MLARPGCAFAAERIIETDMKHPILALAAASAALAFAGGALAQPAGGGVRAACRADIQKLCPDARPGPAGGLRECIKGHWSSLSDGCRSAIAEMRAKRQASGAGAGGADNSTAGGH